MKQRMSRLQRAKQFMPFAALKGFEALLDAASRPKEARVELSEDQLEELNRTIQSLAEGDFVRVLYYTGHRYTESVGIVEAVERSSHRVSVEGAIISFKDIKELNLYE
ncbi:YolD-like family protein [Veillonella rodentium]|uniref:YolD-like protein n=1 Tax=Veillonella rodentium TaxID=248315 RepID=A0A239ZWE0_9FIRM|nr:YolD-like family protein [Veillonella rodentium]SNV75073.1 YolD-like protein [Veillonella rodentium]